MTKKKLQNPTTDTKNFLFQEELEIFLRKLWRVAAKPIRELQGWWPIFIQKHFCMKILDCCKTSFWKYGTWKHFERQKDMHKQRGSCRNTAPHFWACRKYVRLVMGRQNCTQERRCFIQTKSQKNAMKLSLIVQKSGQEFVGMGFCVRPHHHSTLQESV